MFKSARIKLTIWYLLIIMAVSISFSGFIYRSVSLEFQMRLDAIERRLQLRQLGFAPPLGEVRLFIQDLNEARHRVLFILVYTNATIFVFSAVAGYFLAGRTLKPIEDSMEEQRRFIADASHELKTPLTALVTSTEVTLRDKKLNLIQAKKALNENLQEVNNLTNLTKDLLSLTRYQQGNNGLIKETFDIKTIINRSIKKITPLAKSKKITIKKNGVVKIILSAEKESIEKLVTILLDNAFKYTPKGGIVTIETIKDQRYIKIIVSDTGIGIPKEDLHHIFDRFYRADTSRSKLNVSGYGLGLSIAKMITEKHYGSISAESIPGKGSKFVVKLPR